MRKLLFFTASFIALLFIFVTPSFAATPFMYGTASWNSMASAPGAKSYVIYYQRTGIPNYEYAVNVPLSSDSYTINYLQPGVRYWYNVAVIDSSGNPIQWSGKKKLRVNWMP